MLLSLYKLKVQQKITKSLRKNKQKATKFSLIFNSKLKFTFKFVKTKIEQTLLEFCAEVNIILSLCEIDTICMHDILAHSLLELCMESVT